MIVIKGGYVIDPASDREGYYDVLIEEDKVRKVDRDIDVSALQQDASRTGRMLNVINAEGKLVMPGFIDLHVHLREPGYEYKETIQTGARAAAAGGYTSICPMPNTKPAMDNADMLRRIIEKAAQESVVNILPVSAITLEQAGREPVDIKEMQESGAVAFSEDGKSVMDTALYAKAMREAALYDIPIFAHCEDTSLVGNGVINEGKKSEEFGLPGISNAVEDIIVARDILLAKETGVRLHLCHCSTSDSVRMIGLAKKEGLKVTGEVCPHHFCLSDEDITENDSNYKMNPPLRKPSDVQALIEALREDVIDVIATDHAPHSEEEKKKPFTEAPFGIVGLETAFALTLTKLVKSGYLTLRQMVEKMSVNPARILKLDKGCIGEGKIADLVIADPDAEYTIDNTLFYSKGKNTPFLGLPVTGKVEYTFVSGKQVYPFR